MMPFNYSLSPIGISIRRQNSLRVALLGGAANFINTYSSDGQGFAMDFTKQQGQAYIFDTGTPANNVNVSGASDPSTFNSVLTYTAPSVKWIMGSDGLLFESPTNALPIEYDTSGNSLGLLVEPQATNLFLNNRSPVTQGVTVTAVAHTLSFYGTGSITLSGTHSETLNGTGGNDRVSTTFTPSAGTLTCTVSGTIDFVQVETGSVATSPIITAGSTVTRAADQLTIAIGGFPYSSTAGTLYVEWVREAFNGFQTPMNLNGGFSTERYAIYSNGSGEASVSTRDGGVEQGLLATGATSVDVASKVAFSYAADDLAASRDGSANVTDASATLPTITTLNVGNNSNFSHAASHIRAIAYIPENLKAQLQSMTGA